MSEHDEDQDIQRLLEAAGPRENPPADMRARVHDVVFEEWQRMPPQEPAAQMPSRNRILAMAASVLVAFFAGLVFFGERIGETPRWAAEVVRQSGGVSFGEGTGPQLNEGTVVATAGDGLAALALAAGGSVRLDHSTRVTLLGSDSVALLDGRVYIDGGTDEAQKLRIVTPHAVITDVGTLFSVSVAGDALSVAMREGEVHVLGQD